MTDGPTNGHVCCPTCGATQEWSDSCRRCRCEFTLLRHVADAVRASRLNCLHALRRGHIPEALRHARRLYALRPDRPAARLLAVCHLLQGNWAAALVAAQLGEIG